MLRHSPKVRTGCRTCKIRKVKCDEAKPTCSRCASVGRKCGGYDFVDPGLDQSLTWYRPQQLRAHDQSEGRAFQFFCLNVGPVLSGPRDSYFWTHLVMQFSHFEPAVRHAVLAISSLYEDFQDGRRVSSQLPSSPLAIKHYSASISHIKDARDENHVVLACILYLCVEYLLGDIGTAFQHLQHGITILRKGHCGGWIHEHLLPIFRRLSTHPFFSHPSLTVPAMLPSLDVAEDDDGAPFTSLAQAEVHLEHIEAVARELAPFHISKIPREQREAVQCECEKLIQQWRARVASVEASYPSLTVSDSVSLHHLRISYEILRVKVITAMLNSESSFDQHLDSFRTVVSLADEVMQLKLCLPESVPRPCFTFEAGFLPALSFTVNKCRDLATRLRALTLMRGVAVAKEGLVDVGTLYRAGHRVIEIEHGISLNDYSQLPFPEHYPLPPEERRVLGTPINHQLEVVTKTDGSIFYRRALNILTRSSDGHHRSRIEYITDDMLGNDLGVPSMRCSKPESCLAREDRRASK